MDFKKYTAPKKTIMFLLFAFPKNHISRLIGLFSEIKFPKPMMFLIISFFVKINKINLNEVTKSIHEFKSLQEFFTRKISKKNRPVNKDLRALVSPCDGTVTHCGKIINGMLFQAKNKNYILGDLLAIRDTERHFLNGTYCTIYLSPKNYHRFHMPYSGHIIRAKYIPGSLWPVNRLSTKLVENLFCVNERVTTVTKLVCKNKPLVALVAIGATGVGKVKVRYDPKLSTNNKAHESEKEYKNDTHYFEKGEELGLFSLGSTIVLLVSNNGAEFDPALIGKNIRTGELICRLRA